MTGRVLYSTPRPDSPPGLSLDPSVCSGDSNPTYGPDVSSVLVSGEVPGVTGVSSTHIGVPTGKPGQEGGNRVLVLPVPEGA